jgi:hypothetical protein
LTFENPRPVELHSRIQLFDQVDRLFVERGASDLDARRRAEPVQDSRSRLAAAALFGVDDEGVLVTALVAVEAQIRQTLLPFLRRATRG